MTVTEHYLDSILVEVGEFGRYQRRICFFILIACVIAYFPSVVYVFETKQVNHRCKISECELLPSEFIPDWLEYAVPIIDGQPSQCTRYRRTNNNTNSCEALDFNNKIEDPCEKYVYETSEISIVQDFDLHCGDNVWKLTLVGTINSIGLFVGLPIAGVLSDKFGRKTILISTLALSGIAGIVRSFTHNYIFFVSMEFIEAAVGAGAYATAFVLGVELVGPGKRILVGLLINSSYALGGVIEGGLAWAFQSWRPLLQVLYAIPLLCLSYYWLVPESVRWLLAEKKYQQVEDILHNLAKVNKTTISKEHIQKLCNSNESEKKVINDPFRELFSSCILLMRFVNCALCWIATVFVYNGLTINSVELSGNSYLDFILTILVEIPGAIVSYLIIDRIGRRYTLALGFFISAVSCVGLIFMTPDLYKIKLIVYLIGKFGVSINMCVVYTLTTEIFPTSLRNSLLSASSMFGRIGAMVAPQIPLLEATWKPLPLILFAISSCIGCILSILFPETMNKKLPDTIEEAENIGKLEKLQNTKVPVKPNFRDITDCDLKKRVMDWFWHGKQRNQRGKKKRHERLYLSVTTIFDIILCIY